MIQGLFLFLITVYGPAYRFILINLPVSLRCEPIDLLMTIARNNLLKDLAVAFDEPGSAGLRVDDTSDDTLALLVLLSRLWRFVLAVHQVDWNTEVFACHRSTALACLQVLYVFGSLLVVFAFVLLAFVLVTTAAT